MSAWVKEFSKGLSARQALPEDYTQILSIDPDLYGGYDYLPETYYEILRDPASIALVLLRNKEIIGFIAAHAVDDGASMLIEAARIQKSHQNEGFMYKLQLGVAELGGRMFPHFKNARVCIDDSIELHRNYTKENIGFLHEYPITLGNIRSPINMKEAAIKNLAACNRYENGALHLSRREALMCLHEPTNHDRLFPEKRILLHYEGFNLLPSSFKEILAKSDVILGTPDCDLKDFATNFTFNTILPNLHNYNSSKTTNFPLRAFSTALVQRIKKGTHYVINFYGEKSDDFFNHVVKHAQNVRKFCRTENIIIDIFYPKMTNITQEQIIAELNTFDLAFYKEYDAHLIESGPIFAARL